MRKTALFLSFLLGTAGTPMAQELVPPGLREFLGVRTDEVIDDVANRRVIARGEMQWPDGTHAPGYEFICDRRAGTMAALNQTVRTSDTYPVEPGFCDVFLQALRAPR